MQVGDLLKRMGSDISSLERSRYSRAQRDAEKLEAMLRVAGMAPDAAAHIAEGYLAKTPKPQKSEPFVMLTASQNAAVIDWLSQHSKRRNEAVRLWALLFTALHPSSGEIMLSREEMANRIGIVPADVSRIMSELVSIGAVVREKRGRSVRYGMSPYIATHQTGDQLAEARANAPRLRLVQDYGQDYSDQAQLEAAGQMRLID